MKADAAWQALEGKVAGTDPAYKDCRVTPLIALLPADTCPPGAEPACMLPAEVGGLGRCPACNVKHLASLRSRLRLLLPAAALHAAAAIALYTDVPAGALKGRGAMLCILLQPDRGGPQLVVGTLDLNQCAKLPAEELLGQLPQQGDKQRLRAYISNVATWEGARRQGVARRLLRAAEGEAAAVGVQHLYGAVAGWLAG